METIKTLIEVHKDQISSTNMAPMILHLASLYSLNIKGVVQNPSESVFISEDSFCCEFLSYLLPLLEKLGVQTERPLKPLPVIDHALKVLELEDEIKHIHERHQGDKSYVSRLQSENVQLRAELVRLKSDSLLRSLFRSFRE